MGLVRERLLEGWCGEGHGVGGGGVIRVVVRRVTCRLVEEGLLERLCGE